MKNKIVFGLLILLLIPIATATVNMEQTIVTDEAVNNTQNIYSEGDVVSEHNIQTEGDVDLIVNGVDMNAYDSEKFNTLNTYITHNEAIWSDDDSGITSKTVANLIERAVYILTHNSRYYNDIEAKIARALYEGFITRLEFMDVYYSLDFRLRVLEEIEKRRDIENYCQAKIDVAKSLGWSGIECNGKIYTFTGDQAISIEDVTVEEIAIPEEEPLKECNGMYYPLAKNIALAQCRIPERIWEFTEERECTEKGWILGINIKDYYDCNLACIVDTTNRIAEIDWRCEGGGIGPNYEPPIASGGGSAVSITPEVLVLDEGGQL